MEVGVIKYGGIVTSGRVPDRRGVLENVTLGYGSEREYETDAHCMGALIGRYANRIARGRFTLDGHEYRLDTNAGPNHLHGGRTRFHPKRWRVDPVGSGEPRAPR